MASLARFRMFFGWTMVLLSVAMPLRADKGESLGVWQGVLPCPDCRGVRLRLTLRCETETQTPTWTYSMVESFLGTRNGEITNPVDGVWFVDKGRPGDPEALIYRLDPEVSDRAKTFVREGDTLRLLDRRRGDLEPKDKYTLRKVR